MRELRAEGLKNAAAKLKSYGGESKSKSHPDAKQDMELMRSELKTDAFKPHKADGGPIGGGMPRMALGRKRGGAKTHGKGKGTNVNVIVAPRGGQPDPVPVPVPVGGPMGGAPLPHPMPPIAGPAGLGGGPAPMPLKPVGPAGPDAMNTGGKVKRASGGKVSHYDDGAGSGEGRLEKIANYGKKAMRG